MSTMLTKVKSILGLGEYDEYDEEYDDFDEEVMEDEHSSDVIEPVIQSKRSGSGKVVNIHTSSSSKVIISKPLQYDDATEICEALKNRKIVVINTSSLENRIAQRLLDFVSGSCYALGGELCEIEKGVYLLSPSNVEVTNELRNEISSKALFNWNK